MESEKNFSINDVLKITNYEVKTSRNNMKVPVVNDVHLHSIYNPTKEAQALISNYDKNLETTKNVLVLGLGFAYHVYELCRKLESYHGDNYRVTVIEPNINVYNDCIANNLFPNKNIKVHCGVDLHETYSDLQLVKFLISKPLIIQHPASFNLYINFFKSFLDYTAPTSMDAITRHVSDAKFSRYLSDNSDSRSMNDFIANNLLQKTTLTNEFDHLVLAYSHLSNGDF